MIKIKRYSDLETTNEIFTKFGKFLGEIGAKLTDKEASTKMKEPGTEDNDLANKILTHLQGMPTDYNKSGIFNPKTMNKKATDWYYFIDTAPFGQEYKFDIIKHQDFRRSSQNEYSVIATKIDKKPTNVYRFSNNDGNMITAPNYADYKTGDELNVSPKLAKQIFDLADKIYKKVTKTDKEDLRHP